MGEEQWPQWDAAELQAKSDSTRVARYRLHQSWYRQHVLGVGPGERPGRRSSLVGNTLDRDAVRQNPRLNFVNDAAYESALRRADEVQLEGGTLEAERLFHNLLSSMPMCFNVFGAIGHVPAFGEVVQQVMDPEMMSIDQAVCEITPTPALGDRTAFDAMLRGTGAKGNARFIGIETKYTEPFSPKVYDNDRYQEVTAGSDWFVDGAGEHLKATATNQLWRGLMLASLTESAEGATGSYVVVSPADDITAQDAVAQTQRWMTDSSRLRFVSLETLVETAAGHGDPALATWAESFGRRYILPPQS